METRWLAFLQAWLPQWLSGKDSFCLYGRHEFNPWVRKIHWRRKWQPRPVLLPGKSHGQRYLMGKAAFLQLWSMLGLATLTLTSSQHPDEKKDETLCHLGFPGGTSGKEPTCQCRRCKKCGLNPGIRKIPWSRNWHPAPVFLPGKFNGLRSWGHKESVTTEHVLFKPTPSLWARALRGNPSTVYLNCCAVVHFSS